MDLRSIEAYASRYRDCGFNPLPSKPIGNKIHPPYAGYATPRDEGMSPADFDMLARKWNCTAVQVALGPRWRLLGLDLDGPEAVARFHELNSRRSLQSTWTVRHNPSGGMHVWYRIPEGLSYPLRMLAWQGEAKHSQIEILCRGAILVAPPSVSPKSGLPYIFTHGGPFSRQHLPALMPDWLVTLANKLKAEIEAELAARKGAVHRERRPDPIAPSAYRYRRHDVVSAIADPVWLAHRVGIRDVSRTSNQSGWHSCRSIFREDLNPSARLSVTRTGDLVYWECGLPKAMSIFDVAVATGMFPDLQAAINGIGELLGAKHV